MRKELQLDGLDCANCAAELERKISRINGVTKASLTFVNQKLIVEYEEADILEKVIACVNAFEEVRVVEAATHFTAINPEKENKNKHKQQLLIYAIEAVLLIALAVLFTVVNLGQGATVWRYVAFGVLYLAVAYPVLWATCKNVAKGRIFDENFLMAIASVGAFCLGELTEAVTVVLLYQIGETLQAMAVAASRRSVTQLMELKSEWATVLVPQNNHHTHHTNHTCTCGHCHHEEHQRHHATEIEYSQEVRKPEELRVGDILLVRAGERVAVDGVLLDEEAVLDTKSLTGESEYRKVKAGEEILSGCINTGRVFTMRVIRLYQDSAVKKILDMVENAASGKAAPEKFITKFARFYTPIVCGLAIIFALGLPLLSGWISEGKWYFKDFQRYVQSALTFLVISCPCALVISVPLTYFSGIGACARQGILVKGATYLDVAAKVSTVAFDKTGTLTKGNFGIAKIHTANGVTEQTLLSLVAAVEKECAHPIAKAFESVESKHLANNVKEVAGKGVTAMIDGERVLVGSAELLLSENVVLETVDCVNTLVYAAKNGVYIGCVEVGDTVREEAKAVVAALSDLGIEKQVMLTGDRKRRAKHIAKEIGIGYVEAELLPDEKLEKAQGLQKEGGLLYVGDGINDTPVMTVADCAVSMGTLGSAAAVEASDMVLIQDDLCALPKAIKIARKTRKIVVQNIVFSIVMKTAFMALGAVGVLPLSLAVFADVGVMLCAVGNSLQVRGK